MFKGKVKWFSEPGRKRGYGFLITEDGKEHFVHQTSIIMDGFRHLNKGDIVEFEIGTGNNGREQAINVQPVITRKMVEDVLKEDNLYLGINEDSNGVETFAVMDANNVLQSSEQGMSLLEVAAYVGIDVEGIVKGE